MRDQTPIHERKAEMQTLATVQTGLLQRTCACGGAPGVDGKCEECREKRLSLQHNTNDQQYSPISTPTAPLPGHSLSRIQVYADNPTMLQTKLVVNEPGDQYEQEADQVAEQVMRMPEPVHASTSSDQTEGIHIQRLQIDHQELHRQPATEEEDEELHRQPMEENEDEEDLQAKETGGQTPSITPALQTHINSLRGGGQPLSQPLRSFMEPRFGHDFSRVRIHTDAQAAETAQAVHARAYTLGRDVVFGAGEYAPGTTGGKRLLAHELTHVVQQHAVGKLLSERRTVPGNYRNGPADVDGLNLIARSTKNLTALSIGSLIQREQDKCELNVSEAKRITVTKGHHKGNYYQFPAGKRHTNNTNRPLFEHPASVMVTYTGVGNDGTQTIHPAVQARLNELMSALREEGRCLDDESMKQAFVASAFRAPDEAEGKRYLKALKTSIHENPDIFGNLTFPSSLEEMAQSRLGFYGEERHKEFVKALAQMPGWGEKLAWKLVEITRHYKAPRGGSAHHSGLAVDINFPYAISDSHAQMHDISRKNNADALRSAAGVWLSSPRFGFSSYDTSKEIWHQEWLEWHNTSADPKEKQEPVTPQLKSEEPIAPKPSKRGATTLQPGRQHTAEPKPKGQESLPKPSNQKATIPISINISFAKNARAKDVTEYSRKVLEDILRISGLSSATISSTSRDAADQARVMFHNLEKYGVKAQKKLYRSPGREVIDVYEILKKEGKADQEIKTAMTTKIEEIGPTKVSRHASNPNVLNVFDIAPSSISDKAAFEHAVTSEKRVSKFLQPPKDPGYHLEIPQP